MSQTSATLVGRWTTCDGPPWTRRILGWRSWNLARRVWAEPLWADHTQEATCCPAGSGAGTMGTHRRGGHNSASTRVGRVWWHTGSTISWWQSVLSRLRFLVLARRAEGLVTHTVFKQSSKHGLSETLALCALWAAMVLPVPKKRRHPTTSGTLSWRQWCTSAWEVMQPLLTAEEMGKVALSCRFACDTRYQLMGGNLASLPTPATFGRRLVGVGALGPWRGRSQLEPGCEWSALGTQWCLASPWGDRRILLSFARTVALSSHKREKK